MTTLLWLDGPGLSWSCGDNKPRGCFEWRWFTGSRWVPGGAVLNGTVVIIPVISRFWVLLVALAFWRVSLLSRGEACPCDPALLQCQEVLNELESGKKGDFRGLMVTSCVQIDVSGRVAFASWFSCGL